MHIQYWHDGGSGGVRRHLPSAERVLRWYTELSGRARNDADVPEWNLVDWASIFVSGRSSILTALWARGLNDFAELSDAVGHTGSAAWARDLYESAAEGYQDFSDPGRGLYVDHIFEGQWDLCMERFTDLGVTAIIELPPAGTLVGLAKRALKGVELLAVKTPDDLDAARTLIKEHSA